MSIKELYFDLSKQPRPPQFIYGRMGDNGLQKIDVFVTNEDETFNLSGYTISFEGTSAGEKVKVFDSKNIIINNYDITQGKFSYIFPSKVFSVPGMFKEAYFSFTKNGQRTSTDTFNIQVFGNSDIDVPEAESILSNYDQLVKDLETAQKESIIAMQKEQSQYLSNLNTSVYEIQTKANALKDQIEAYNQQAETIKNEALEKVSEALEQLNNNTFYTRKESDENFLSKVDFEIHAKDNSNPHDVTKDQVNLGNVDDYATATQEEAEAGLAKDKFMTPFLVFKAISKWVQAKFVSATEPQTILGNKDFTETPTVNDVEVVVKKNIPVKSFWGSGTALKDSGVNARLVFGSLLGVDPLHQLTDIPFTLNAGMYEAIMTRDANLFFDINIRLQGGGASTDYSDYYYISLESGTQTGGSGETKTDFVMLGANNGQRLNLSNTLTGKAYVSLKKGQKFAITVTGLRSTQKIFTWQFLSGTIEELS